jgi:hypothetical protein
MVVRSPSQGPFDKYREVDNYDTFLYRNCQELSSRPRLPLTEVSKIPWRSITRKQAMSALGPRGVNLTAVFWFAPDSGPSLTMLTASGLGFARVQN